MSDEDSVELKADCAFSMCNCVKQKLNEANLLLSIREKQIEELERQLKIYGILYWLRKDKSYILV